MSILYIFTILNCICIAYTFLEPNEKNSEMDHLKIITESQNKFTLDMYKALSKSSENIFFSPSSIATCLAMVHMGSKGNTENQINSVMHFPESKETLKQGYKAVMSSFKNESDEYTLKSTNMMYMAHNLLLLKEFETSIKDDFLSISKIVDFAQSESVRQEINGAVQKETNDKIKDLMKPGVLDANAKMVLVNAIYFKGFWVDAFSKDMTNDGPFWINEKESINVPMMFGSKTVRYGRYRELDCSAISMDYKGGRMSMTFILPNKIGGLAALEEKLTSSMLVEMEKGMSKSEVEITLPKFKLEETLNLSDVLKQMGMSDLFDEREADLSGITGSKYLYVSHAVHKAFLEVNEEGAEAAAATAVVMGRGAALKPSFTANIPFVFCISDTKTASIIFFGRFIHPNGAPQSIKDEF